jgi:hypothetical protein
MRFEGFDFSHTKYFIKNELIKTDFVNTVELDKIVGHALAFFSQYISELKVVETDIGYDINYKEHELGSYGIRENEFLKYIYGTGCAEPRLSKLIYLSKNGVSH